MNDNNLDEGNLNINNENPLEINNIIDENKINNQNPFFEEQDELLKDNPLLNMDNKEENYDTDSDIDDPRYMPSGNIGDKNQIDTQLNNIDNQNKNEVLLKSKVMALQNDANLANQTMKELENENNLLINEILKNNEKIKSNEVLNY